MEIDLNRYREGYKGKYLYKHVVMVRPPDVPPKVPPKDERKIARVVMVDKRLVESVRTPDSETVGGWDFGLLDQHRFATKGNVEDDGEQRASSSI
jgi:hypothetical protein